MFDTFACLYLGDASNPAKQVLYRAVRPASESATFSAQSS
ncbi:hypothetical protein ACPOL_3987 [Acidisarcina polymorpha]|uniref:Uncharacterized protein n=1 Tax=Acidisarcina polymorpha TaxID=2211140 RepID=A0A2Z5G437_9BACT|nr:hypothetical protein ACPOL_3987 [Acidisarcina polymorpha]